MRSNQERNRKWNSDTATEAGRSGAKGREARVTWGRGDEAEAAERNDVETCCSSQAEGLAGRENLIEIRRVCRKSS